jgi:hypothetical protein
MTPTTLRCGAALLLGLATLAALSPAAPDDGPVTRWPEKAGAGGQVFDGGGFVELKPAPVVGEGAFSVSVWVNAADLAGGNPQYGRGVARSTRGELIGDWLLAVHPDGRVRFCNWRKKGDDPTGSHVTRKPLVAAEAWVHLAAVWDGAANRLYVNGVEAAHDAGATATGWGAGHEVGRSWTEAGYHWDGRIDDLRIYRRALTAADAAEAFKAGPPPESRPEVKPAGDARVSRAVDQQILARLNDRKVEPGPAADDAEFHRRATLDLTGRIPIPSETEAFLADRAADKRARLVETLLAGREMPPAWAPVLSGWLMPRESRRDPQFVGYLRNGLAQNKPWDQFAREMLLARPTGPGDQAASLFLSSRRAALQDHSIARDVGRAFFGVNLRCAQCHDHPQVRQWTQERFYGLSAFFARTYEHTYADAGNQPRVAWAERASGELEYLSEGKKKVAPLVFLDGTRVEEPPGVKDAAPTTTPRGGPPPAPPFSRREALVKVGVGPKSPYFTRAVVNRVWQRLMGRGLVEPVDMMHDGNAATHPRLLDLLTEDFAAHGCDLRRLIAVIMQSDAYARSSRWPGKGDAPDETLYAVAVLRPLDADQMALSLALATGYYDSQLNGTPKRTVAQVRSTASWREVLAAFDSDGDEFEPTTAQALFLTNSDYVQTTFLAKSNLVQALAALKDDAAVARKAYLAVLSRWPSKEEADLVGGYLAKHGARGRAEACREVLWALVSGAEFRFNH